MVVPPPGLRPDDSVRNMPSQPALNHPSRPPCEADVSRQAVHQIDVTGAIVGEAEDDSPIGDDAYGLTPGPRPAGKGLGTKCAAKGGGFLGGIYQSQCPMDEREVLRS